MDTCENCGEIKNLKPYRWQDSVELLCERCMGYTGQDVENMLRTVRIVASLSNLQEFPLIKDENEAEQVRKDLEDTAEFLEKLLIKVE